MRCHALQHGGGAGFEIDGIRQGHQLFGWDDGILGVGTARHRVGNAVARLDHGYTRADGFDGTRAFAARRERKIGLVETRAEVDVDEVDARSRDLHQRLAGGGCGDGRIHELQYFGTADIERPECVS